jgi:hypothetical protein
VSGPRFSLTPQDIQSQFPPPQSLGEYYNVLPHVILNRPTLAWERTIDNSAPSNPTVQAPWLALLLLDNTADPAPVVTNLTVQDLLNVYGQSATPAGQPEFVQILPRGTAGVPAPGQLLLETGQHLNDSLTVIDLPKSLLYQILPTQNDISFLAHVREGAPPNDPDGTAIYPVVFCNRLPSPGTASTDTDSAVGTQSTVHLVSLESRKPLLDELLTAPQDDNLVRLVSLANWSFSTLQESTTFAGWLESAWCPDGCRTDPSGDGDLSTCAAGVVHTLRMPPNSDTTAESYFAQGYAPISHQTRQGNHLVSWYRSPFVPGATPTNQLGSLLPATSSDQLVRYLSDVGMFDTSYAAAWELGRNLTLRSDKVAVSLFNWKRANAQYLQQAGQSVDYLPFAPNNIGPDFPGIVTQWFSDLLVLKNVPFQYLVPREEMLPVNSLRFFDIDLNWLECLLDGAFSVGRVTAADVNQDNDSRNTGLVPTAPVYSGFLLRSPVVSGWPNLGVEGYDVVVPDDEATNYIPTAPPITMLRMERLSNDILLCIFDGAIQTVDIHEHPDAIHFGVDVTKPEDITTYNKCLRDAQGNLSTTPTPLPWKNGSNDKRTLDINSLAGTATATNSALFGVAMIEGVEKVRFLKASS